MEQQAGIVRKQLDIPSTDAIYVAADFTYFWPGFLTTFWNTSNERQTAVRIIKQPRHLFVWSYTPSRGLNSETLIHKHGVNSTNRSGQTTWPSKIPCRPTWLRYRNTCIHFFWSDILCTITTAEELHHQFKSHHGSSRQASYVKIIIRFEVSGQGICYNVCAGLVRTAKVSFVICHRQPSIFAISAEKQKHPNFRVILLNSCTIRSENGLL